MQKLMTNIMSTILILVVIADCFCSDAFAAGSSIAFDKSILCVDEMLTVTTRFSTSSSDPMFGLEGYITYDPSVIEFVSGNNCSLLTTGKIKFVLQSTEKTNLSETIKFNALKAGKSTISLGSLLYLNRNDKEQSLAGSSATISVSNHIYDNDCDASCNRCNSTRNTTHTYSYDCDKECNVCGNVRTADHTYDNDCDSLCNICNTSRITAHIFGDWATTKNATCTGSGNQRRICSICSMFEDKVIEALGHSFSDPIITKKASCTQTGVETGTCTRCNKKTTNTLPQIEHLFGEWTESLSATCTDGGIMLRKCASCNKEDKKITEKLGHNFDVPVVVKEPTISSTGIKEGKCKRCGQTTSEIIPCTTSDKNTGIDIESDEGTFSEGMSINITQITDNDSISVLSNIFNKISDKFTAYNIAAYLDGNQVQPNGSVKITFQIPDNFSQEIELYSVINGAATKLDVELSHDKNAVTTETEILGTIVICDLYKEMANNLQSNTPSPQETSPILWIICIAGGFVLIASSITITFVVAKRKFTK